MNFIVQLFGRGFDSLRLHIKVPDVPLKLPTVKAYQIRSFRVINPGRERYDL